MQSTTRDKGIVERTFGTINALLCQHLPGYTGSDVTRRGPAAETEACFSVTQLQDLLDEWLIHYHHRPHKGLRHPTLPKTALTPNQMWAALVSVAGHVAVPLTRDDYLELLPVRWLAIAERGIRLHHRTYDCDLLAPYRGQPSPVTARGGRWEVHTNPHDLRQIWLRLPDGTFTEIPWIHRDHIHRPFNERTWQYIRTTLTRHTDPDSHEADLADALDQLMRRTHTGTATPAGHRLLARTPAPRTPLPPPHPHHDQDENNHEQHEHDEHDEHEQHAAEPGRIPAAQPGTDTDSLDDLDDLPDEPDQADSDEERDNDTHAARPRTGLGLYDPAQEALNW